MRILPEQVDSELYVRKTTQKKEFGFEIQLVDHCNLNCAYCDHFAPFAEKTYYKIDDFEKSIKRMSELFGNRIIEMKLQGGEPLLHPNLIDIMRISREVFPNLKDIKLITNGLLLEKQSDLFWKFLKKYEIGLFVSEYPLDTIDYNKLLEKARLYGIRCGSFGTRENSMRCDILDLTGSQDARQSFLSCNMANQCIILRNNKLYTCPTAACIEMFAKKFHLAITEDMINSIDIFELNSDEILHNLTKEMELCKFCKSSIYNLPWTQSKRKITEYLD